MYVSTLVVCDRCFSRVPYFFLYEMQHWVTLQWYAYTQGIIRLFCRQCAVYNSCYLPSMRSLRSLCAHYRSLNRRCVISYPFRAKILLGVYTVIASTVKQLVRCAVFKWCFCSTRECSFPFWKTCVLWTEGILRPLRGLRMTLGWSPWGDLPFPLRLHLHRLEFLISYAHGSRSNSGVCSWRSEYGS